MQHLKLLTSQTSQLKKPTINSHLSHTSITYWKILYGDPEFFIFPRYRQIKFF